MAPLNKRLPREFVHNLGKYLGIFLLFLFAISMGSGFLSAAYSIEVIQKGLHEKANVEDFHFATQFEASKRSIAAVEETGCTVYEDFTADVPFYVAGDDRVMNCRLINQESRRVSTRATTLRAASPKAPQRLRLTACGPRTTRSR